MGIKNKNGGLGKRIGLWEGGRVVGEEGEHPGSIFTIRE